MITFFKLGKSFLVFTTNYFKFIFAEQFWPIGRNFLHLNQGCLDTGIHDFGYMNFVWILDSGYWIFIFLYGYRIWIPKLTWILDTKIWYSKISLRKHANVNIYGYRTILKVMLKSGYHPDSNDSLLDTCHKVWILVSRHP